VINPNGETLMTGGTRSFGGSDYDTWLIKTDSIGNVLWHETYNGISTGGGGGTKVLSLLDGNFAILGGVENTGTGNSDALLMKVDPTGDQVWMKKYVASSGSHSFWSGSVLSDGSVLACGQTTNTNDGSQAGWLMKVDAIGDTLWTRTYNPSGGIDLLRDMVVLDNGDIVMVGFGRGENSTTQDGWILRVDSMGCVVENCFSVGVEELEQEEHYFSVYPNPASALVQIQRSSLKLQGISVRDVMGRVLRYTITLGRGGTQNDLQLDVSNWPNGVYLVSVTDEQGNNFTQRLVVQH
jgi:hypothetical protein